MDVAECVVVGAGVVGLACARALASAGLEPIVIEAADGIGTETSSRNSEVIHAGLYYPTGSLKARACVEGRRRLYAYLDRKGIAYNRCGKLIVATSEDQTPTLARIRGQAEINGVEDIDWISADAVRALEPELSCVGALMSGQTGIVDSHGYMLAMLGDIESAGGMVAFNTRVVGGRITPDGIVLRTVGDGVETEILARRLVTNAGLHADRLLGALEGFPRAHVPELRYAKGCYFAYAGSAPFSRLIYPVPEEGGLGVHVTIDLGGAMRFGPDVQWVSGLDYDVDPARADGFYAEVRKYWPALPDGSIVPAYAGIRPKLTGPGEPAADFLISGPAQHGVPGLVNLLGIESPGLTASLALADIAAEALGDVAVLQSEAA